MRETMSRAASILAIIMATGAVGCGNSVDDYCEGWAECEGGNDNDREACVAINDGKRKANAAYDCLDEWEARMDCRAENSSCDATDPANPDYDEGNACDFERDELDVCVQTASTNEP